MESKQDDLPELWTATEIAKWMRLSRHTVLRSVVTHPNFPAPVPGTVKKKRWVKDAVVDFIAARRAA